MFEGRKTYVVHDWIDSYGGAERVVEAIVELVRPEKFFTLLARNESSLTQTLRPILETSWLQKTPFAFELHRYLLQLYPRAIEDLNVFDADLVISSSHCVAKGVLTRSDQIHICYLHTPARYLWDQTHDYLSEASWIKRIYARYVFHSMRQWDINSSNRVDFFLANSKNVARRIWKTYRRPSTVVPPVVDLTKFQYQAPENPQNYFVAVSRLVSQKKVYLAVEACTKAGVPLKVIGAGPELSRLQKIAGKQIEFLGRRSDQEMIEILRNSQGLLFTPEEDFGMVPLEANALGIPVLAFGSGGALETVIPGITGEFFFDQNSDCLAKALMSWQPERYSVKSMIANAENFSREKFLKNFEQAIHEALHSQKLKSSLPPVVFR